VKREHIDVARAASNRRSTLAAVAGGSRLDTKPACAILGA
jgi:hypothetical protein